MRDNSDDEAAFADVFDRHRDVVYAFLLGKISDPEAARDVLQETFLRLWRRFGEVAELADGPQRAWLFTVARNLVIDRHRAQTTQRATHDALVGEASRTDGHQPSTEDRAALADQLDQLGAAVARLPEEQREVLSMSVVGGMTSQEIAEVLDGQLTITLWATRNELEGEEELLALLQRKSGRLLFGGVPTGVEVGFAMHHGGPFPATTDSRSTSVGVYAIKRFLRPLAFQDCPDPLLPEALKEGNPLGISRMVDGHWVK
jgi:RNA polymerase sigma factor (sigma-70 family)